jgi:hypothetical protein
MSEIKIDPLLGKIPQGIHPAVKDLVSQGLQKVDSNKDGIIDTNELAGLDENKTGLISIKDIQKLADIKEFLSMKGFSQFVAASRAVMDELFITHRDQVNERFPLYKLEKPRPEAGLREAAAHTLVQQLQLLKRCVERSIESGEVFYYPTPLSVEEQKVNPLEEASAVWKNDYQNTEQARLAHGLLQNAFNSYQAEGKRSSAVEMLDKLMRNIEHPRNLI